MFLPKTSNPCTLKYCAEIGCCLNCAHYRGAIEFIPTHLNISCSKQDHVYLILHGYPVIKGQTKNETDCFYWTKKTEGAK